MTTLTRARPSTRPATRMRSRGRAVTALVRPVVRLVPWWHLLVGALLATAVVWRARGEVYASVDSVTSALRMALIPLVLSAGFVLDDPTEDALAGTPVTVMARRLLRVVPTVVVVGVVWWALLAWAESTPAMRAMLEQRAAAGGPPAAEIVSAAQGGRWLLPWAALSVEATALLAIALAGAAYGVRFAADRSGGMLAAGVVLCGLVAAYALPMRWAVLVRPGVVEQVWHDAHVRWAWAAGLGALLFVQAGRDPGRRRLAVRLRRNDREMQR